jgi:hypothetical protein
MRRRSAPPRGPPSLWALITVEGTTRKWLGDTRVFQWPHGWPLFDGSLVECALMALERWFYELIEQGVTIEPWVSRIMRESESLAFASLLLEVGKRLPSLFGGVLKPLLRVWELWYLDSQLVTQRLNGTPMPFDTEEAIGCDRWDAFAAECGVLLLAEDN